MTTGGAGFGAVGARTGAVDGVAGPRAGGGRGAGGAVRGGGAAFAGGGVAAGAAPPHSSKLSSSALRYPLLPPKRSPFGPLGGGAATCCAPGRARASGARRMYRSARVIP